MLNLAMLFSISPLLHIRPEAGIFFTTDAISKLPILLIYPKSIPTPSAEELPR